ncbi:copper resistance protein CopC [Streptomyces sp. JJ36]|nr:copper resistance protein CopC [Streptomyces sp. JJ36]
MLTALALLVAACACLLGTARPAAAHATLTGSDPADGAVVDSAPDTVTLTFSEQVAPGSLRVLDPQGERADTGEILDLCSGDTVRYGTPLRTGLPDGTYTVAWQAVSADSHPVSGAFTFSVGAPSRTSVALPEQPAGGGAVGLLYDLARYAAYAGFLLLAGGAAFLVACWPAGASRRAVRRLVAGGWVGLTAATLALLLLRTPYTGSGELADALDLGGLKAEVGTGTGTALVSRLLLLATAALFVAVLLGPYARYARDATGGTGRGGSAGEGAADTGAHAPERAPAERRDLRLGLALGGSVVATGLAATWALSEHATTGIQTSVAVPVDILHLLAVAAWLGGLATLLTGLRTPPGPPRAAVLRFSTVALGSVGVLAATGLYQSWRQVGSQAALTGTDYGRLLLVKAALVGVLLALGLRSRRRTARLTAPAAPDPAAEAAGTDPPGTDAATGTANDTAGADAAEYPVAAAGTPGTDPAGGPAGPEAAGTAKPTRTAAGRPATPRVTPGEAAPEADTARAGATEAAHPTGAAPTAPAGRTGRTASASSGSHAGPADPAGDDRGPDVPAPTGPAGPRDPGAPAGPPAPTTTDPVRAAQLARQRAAVSAARRRRERDADPARAALRRSVLAETGIAVVLLAVTTALTGTQPARTAEAAAPVTAPSTAAPDRPLDLRIPFDTGGPDGAGTAAVSLDPGRTGRNTLRVRTTGPDGGPLDAPEVKVAFTLPGKDIGPLRVAPERTSAGRWRAPDVQLPVAGEWELALTVRTSAIDQVTETRPVTIG